MPGVRTDIHRVRQDGSGRTSSSYSILLQDASTGCAREATQTDESHEGHTQSDVAQQTVRHVQRNISLTLRLLLLVAFCCCLDAFFSCSIFYKKRPKALLVRLLTPTSLTSSTGVPPAHCHLWTEAVLPPAAGPPGSALPSPERAACVRRLPNETPRELTVASCELNRDQAHLPGAAGCALFIRVGD
jgi:hypothetical protein